MLRPVESNAQPAIFFLPFGNLPEACYAGTLTPQGNSLFKGQGKTMISGALRSISRKWLIALAVGLLATSSLWAGQWVALGPDGGDVRSLSYDPRNPDHIFLGTSTGTLFASQDGGRNWARFAHLGSGDDYVLDHIAFDSENPNRMFVAAWSVENQQSGDLFRSTNGGKTWEALPGMHGKSIRAMAIAASDHKTIVTGALDGVYRSNDGGDSWQKLKTSNRLQWILKIPTSSMPAPGTSHGRLTTAARTGATLTRE